MTGLPKFDITDYLVTHKINPVVTRDESNAMPTRWNSGFGWYDLHNGDWWVDEGKDARFISDDRSLCEAFIADLLKVRETAMTTRQRELGPDLYDTLKILLPLAKDGNTETRYGAALMKSNACHIERAEALLARLSEGS